MLKHDIVSIRDLTNDGMLGLFELASELSVAMRGRLDLAREAIMATLFYEPSTRTRMSFEAAMLRLGGQVISMTDPGSSSAAKGETLADSMRIIDGYTDLIVLRHPCEGAARVAADFAGVPVINAGDGSREHPTQTLLDLYTILQEKGRIEGVTVALCGDLKHGRTVHSLAQALARFHVRMICVAPAGLELPEHLRSHLREHFGANFEQYDSLEGAPLRDCDVLYVTRIQKERFNSPGEFERVRSSYQISRQTLTRAREDAIVLHPLPRVDELDYSLDGDPRAAYFRQAAYGVPVRMALIATLLGLRSIPHLFVEGVDNTRVGDGACINARCITRCEPGLPSRLHPNGESTYRCGYCERVQEAACMNR